ncbi:MAG TPA: class I SAM-dependent methyltransferase [Egicoccus sp.]|nr:class I SAM-dependent methyltransferase [Egicoccus sp.]HSK23327.1 class I SAM-dependent methyltransferase [Egicoccus sp.]
MDEHAQINLANWESRVPIHAVSEDYGLSRYVEDPRHLSGVVAYDAPHLGDLTGLRVAHPQCHIGTDTLSLARLGGEVTGIDFSPAALEVARDLAERAGPPVRYVEAAVDDIPAALPEIFDLVYTGVGALNWLPSVARWARIMAGLLAPGGRLYLRESHPMLGALDDERDDDLLVAAYPYFETPEPNEWVTEMSYTGGDEPIASPVTREWAHGLAETVQAVLDAGLVLTRLEEHTELEWQFLDWMVRTDEGRWVLPDGRERLPMMFTLEAVKPG